MDFELIQEMGSIFFHQTVHQTSYYVYNFFLPPVIFFSIFFYIIAISGIFSKPRKKKYNGNNIEWPSVTIQIPTFNEPVALRCIESCLNLDYPKDKLQIIVGDDSTNPEVSKLINGFAKKHKRVKVTRRGSNKGFKAGNLNHMLKFSNGEIIVIFDSDYKPSKKFLKKIVRPFVEDEKVGCVQSRWNFLNEDQNFVSKLGFSILMIYQRLVAPINERLGISLLFGSGQAVRKDLIVSLGGWQEGSLTEDVEFSVRVLKTGYKIVYLDNLKVSGELPYTVKGLRIQQKRWAYGNLRAFLDHMNSLLFGDFSFLQKVMLIFTLLGYFSSFFILPYIISSTIYFFSTPPAPIDIFRFVTETSKFVFITSGFLLAGIVALSKEKRLDLSLSVLFSSLTVGILVSFSVCKGFVNAFLGKKMEWKIITKEGNFNFLSQDSIDD
jgi:cellulose synthase/poly-beta-1,6-N-acetylglucosamine synthase-like glycosyltransferase